MINFFSGDGIAKCTETAATRIRRILGGGPGFTHLVNMRYTDGGTAHVLTILRGTSRGKVVAPVAAAGTSVQVDTALTDGLGNAIAASDLVAIQLDDGTWHLSAVTTYVAATLTISVLATAIPTGRSVLAGAKIVCYGVQSDANHANQVYAGGSSSAAVNFPAVTGAVLSLCKAPRSGEPLVFDSDNATNAGTLNYANFGQTMQ